MNKRNTVIKFAIAVALLIIAYIPAFRWMFERWNEHESYYSHGILIPLISVFLVWQRRKTLAEIEPQGRMAGLIIVSACLLVHVIAAFLKVYSVSGFSFVFALFGLILFLFGKEMARRLLFPVFFLLTMVPLPLVLIGNLTVRLKLFVAQIATFILNRIGFPSMRDGSVILMPHSYVSVEAPCSGLRSLIALLTLGLLFAYAAKMSRFKKGVIFASSVPIALATNVVRVAMLAMVNDLYGEKVAMSFFHDFSGFFMFGIAFLGLHSVTRILEERKGSDE